MLCRKRINNGHVIPPPIPTQINLDNNMSLTTPNKPQDLMCGQAEYCDSERWCYPCSACATALDAFDGICPEKCGGSVIFEPGSRIPDVDEPAAIGPIKDVVLPNTQAYRSLVTANPSSVAGVVFATVQAGDESDSNRDSSNIDSLHSRLMTERLLAKLTVLGGIIRQDRRFRKLSANVLVLQAYVLAEPDVNQKTVTYHHEGRAALLSLSCPEEHANACANPSLLGEVVRSSHHAGFDFVTLQEDGLVYVSVLPDGCSTPIDLVFLLDSSGSIEDPSINGIPGQFADKELEFVKAIVGAFDVGPAAHQTRVGVASFSIDNSINFKLNKHASNAAVLKHVDDVPYMAQGTYTREALELVRTQMFREDAGMRPASSGIPRVLVIVTDGQSNAGHSPIKNKETKLFEGSEAQLLHNADVNVFSIGVGKGITKQAQEELDGVASNPPSEHSFVLKSFSRIFSIVDKISHSMACDAVAALACGSETTVTLGEGAFLYYTVARSEESVRIQVVVTAISGEVHLFASSKVQTPGPVNQLGYWVSPRICSRTLLGCSTSVLSWRQPATF